MQPKLIAEITADIDAWMTKSGLTNDRWYVGIASDIEQRLFVDHNVPRLNHWFIYRKATTHEAARAIEKAYLAAGCKGGPGGGDCTTCYVYAYVITSGTRE